MMGELTCAQRLRRLNAIRRTIANDTRQVIPPRSLAAFVAAGGTFVLFLLLPLEALQRQAAGPGGLDNLHVLCWLSAEREAVRPSGTAGRPWRFAERAR